MKSRFIAAFSVTLALATGTLAVVSAQQSKTNLTQKAAAAASQAKKKPNIVVFALSGTPTPAKKREKPSGLPHLRSLTTAEKLKIAQGVQGIPNLSGASVTPILTLSPDHMVDPAGDLVLGAPAWDISLAYYDVAVELGNYEFHCEELEVNDREYVEMGFQADAGNVYMVDFLIVLPPPQGGDNGIRDFQMTVSGTQPSYKQVTNQEVSQATQGWGTHLTTNPFLVSQSGWYTVRLQLKPKLGFQSPQPNWGPWYFIQVDVTKFVPSS